MEIHYYTNHLLARFYLNCSKNTIVDTCIIKEVVCFIIVSVVSLKQNVFFLISTKQMQQLSSSLGHMLLILAKIAF